MHVLTIRLLMRENLLGREVPVPQGTGVAR
jgi:hypothetical protein